MQLGAGSPLVRKTRGKVITWREETAQLRLQMLPGSYTELEDAASKKFKNYTTKIEEKRNVR